MLQDQNHHKLSKAESARINGAKSTGPTTEEGRARSAKNNLKHGVYSSRVVLDGENADAFAHLKQFFQQTFDPQDIFESECVTSMANARWRIRRLEASETSNLNIAIANTDGSTHNVENLDVANKRAIAISNTANSMENTLRLEERLTRIFERNYKLLTNYRRKSNRAMPDRSDLTEPKVELPVEKPTAEAGEPKQEPSPGNRGAATLPIIAKIAAIFVIFAVLLLPPTMPITQKLPAAFTFARTWS